MSGQNLASRLLSLREAGNAGQDHKELIAARPRDLRLHALLGDLIDDALKALSDLAKQFVARGVTQRVVNPLELIQIDIQQREMPISTPRLSEALRQVIPRPLAVRQPGERIEVSQPVDARVCFLANGDVPDDGKDVTA